MGDPAMVTVRVSRPGIVMINGRTAPLSKGTILDVDEDTAKQYPFLEPVPVQATPEPEKVIEEEPAVKEVKEAPKKIRKKSGSARPETPVPDQEPDTGTAIIP